MTFSKGNFLCAIYIAFLLGMWILLTVDHWKAARLLKGMGALLGVAGYCFFSFSFLLSSRWKPLENWFGGLDKIYHLHHRVGVWGFCLILVHPWFLATKWIPQRFDKFFSFLFPIHGRVSVNLGSYAFWLMLLLLGITLLKLLPYDKWKISHKFMSLVFFLASLHFLFSSQLFGPSIASKALLCIPMSVGFAGIVYKQFFPKPLIEYQVNRSNILNDNTIEVFLKPKGKSLSYIPGQYAFFSFQGPSISCESHPFTLCDNPDGISILVKARGDFTKSFYQHVKPGDLAYLEGPYGRFDYTKEGNSQIWIGGGVGIVPFLIWARLLFGQRDEKKIDLFYCVHRKQDAIFLDELHHIHKEMPLFQIHLFCSEENRRINVPKIQKTIDGLQKRKILMCGPKRLTEDLCRQFSQIGVPKRNILFEDFEFF